MGNLLSKRRVPFEPFRDEAAYNVAMQYAEELNALLPLRHKQVSSYAPNTTIADLVEYDLVIFPNPNKKSNCFYEYSATTALLFKVLPSVDQEAQDEADDEEECKQLLRTVKPKIMSLLRLLLQDSTTNMLQILEYETAMILSDQESGICQPDKIFSRSPLSQRGPYHMLVILEQLQHGLLSDDVKTQLFEKSLLLSRLLYANFTMSFRCFPPLPDPGLGAETVWRYFHSTPMFALLMASSFEERLAVMELVFTFEQATCLEAWAIFNNRCSGIDHSKVADATLEFYKELTAKSDEEILALFPAQTVVGAARDFECVLGTNVAAAVSAFKEGSTTLPPLFTNRGPILRTSTGHGVLNTHDFLWLLMVNHAKFGAVANFQCTNLAQLFHPAVLSAICKVLRLVPHQQWNASPPILRQTIHLQQSRRDDKRSMMIRAVEPFVRCVGYVVREKALCNEQWTVTEMLRRLQEGFIPKAGFSPSNAMLPLNLHLVVRCAKHQACVEWLLMSWRVRLIPSLCRDVAHEIMLYLLGSLTFPKRFLRDFNFPTVCNE